MRGKGDSSKWIQDVRDLRKLTQLGRESFLVQAEKLSISENQVYVLKATGKLPFVKIGRSTRFDEHDIADFIRKRKRRIE